MKNKKLDNDTELYVVTSDGEIVDTLENKTSYTKLSYGDKVIRRNTLDYLQDSITIKYPFIKINPDIFGEFCKKYSMFPILACHIGYMDNICEFTNGRKVSLQSLQKLCGVSMATAKRQIKGMVSDDVLHKIKDGRNVYFMMNPWICCRGKRISCATYEEFKFSEHRPENGVGK